MSEYRSWITDYPQRCADLLKLCDDAAKQAGREVTLLLAVASTCISVPCERMIRPSKKRLPHPSDDRDEDTNRAARFDELLSSQVRSLDIWRELEGKIRYGELRSARGGPDDWPELNNVSSVFGKEKHFKSLLWHLRNALAHGNIHARGDPIETLVFLSRRHMNSPKYEYLVLQPEDLRRILLFWIDSLGKLGVSPVEIARALDSDHLAA